MEFWPIQKLAYKNIAVHEPSNASGKAIKWSVLCCAELNFVRVTYTTALGMLVGSWPSLDRCDAKSPSDRCSTHSGCLIECRDMAHYAARGMCCSLSAAMCCCKAIWDQTFFPPVEPQSCSTALPHPPSKSSGIWDWLVAVIYMTLHQTRLLLSPRWGHQNMMRLCYTWDFQWLLLSSPASVMADFSVATEFSTIGLWEQNNAPLHPIWCLLTIMFLPEMLAESLCQWNCLRWHVSLLTRRGGGWPFFPWSFWS